MTTTGDATSCRALVAAARPWDEPHSAHHRHDAAGGHLRALRSSRVQPSAGATSRRRSGGCNQDGSRSKSRAGRELACDYHRGLHHIPRVGFPGEPGGRAATGRAIGSDSPIIFIGYRDATATGASIATRRGVICAHREPAYPRQRLALHRGRRCLCGLRSLRRARTERGGARPLHHHSALSPNDRDAAGQSR